MNNKEEKKLNENEIETHSCGETLTIITVDDNLIATGREIHNRP